MAEIGWNRGKLLDPNNPSGLNKVYGRDLGMVLLGECPAPLQEALQPMSLADMISAVGPDSLYQPYFIGWIDEIIRRLEPFKDSSLFFTDPDECVDAEIIPPLRDGLSLTDLPAKGKKKLNCSYSVAK